MQVLQLKCPVQVLQLEKVECTVQVLQLEKSNVWSYLPSGVSLTM
jgi:hypothetical protein